MNHGSDEMSAEEGKDAEVKSEEASAAAGAAPEKPRKKGRFKERKKKPGKAELTEIDHHPEFINCFEYLDDESAVLAEEQIAEEVPTGGAYTDSEFCGMDAVYKDYSHPPMGALPADLIQWLRIGAKEIGGPNNGVDNPELFPADWNKGAEEGKGDDEGVAAGEEGKDGENPEEGAPERFPARLDNIVQGQLGNRWFLNALAPLLNRVDVLARCFVSKRHAAKGLYTVKIFKEGRWRYVHVDDTIPCDMSGQPLFSMSFNPNAIWIMLLEKAYAKIHGCYEKLATGVVEEAMRDLTLGIHFDVTMPRPVVNEKGEGVPTDFASKSSAAAALGIQGEGDPTQELWERLSRVVPLNRDNRHVLRFKRAEGISVAVRSSAAVPLKSGRSVDPRKCVMTGRGYALHALLQIEDPENKAQFRLVVMRNPWGLRSWGGDWAHNDIKWDENPRIKGLVSSIVPEFSWNPEDGIFAMSWADFCVQFDTIHAVRIPPSDWTLNRFQGEWHEDSITDGRGGRPGAPDFAINPMFGFEYTGSAKPECMVCVSQRESRWRSDEGESLHTSVVSDQKPKRLPGLGFAIVKLTGDHLRLHEYWPAKVVTTSAVAGAPAACVRSRDASNAFFTITEGRYAIVPFTYEGGEGGGGNAFYIDMWSDYDFEIFECFQEDAVSEAPDSDDESDVEGGVEDGAAEGKSVEADDEGKSGAVGDSGGKDGEEKKKKKRKRDPDFMTLEPPRQEVENLEELTMMSMQRTMSNLCISVRDLKKEVKNLDGNVKRIMASR